MLASITDAAGDISDPLLSGRVDGFLTVGVAAYRGLHLPRAHGMCSLRTWVAWSVVAALLLVSPVLAFLMIIVTEMLIDLLLEAGTTAVCAIAIGGVGWVLFRRFWQPSSEKPQSRPGVIYDEGAIAAPPV